MADDDGGLQVTRPDPEVTTVPPGAAAALGGGAGGGGAFDSDIERAEFYRRQRERIERGIARDEELERKREAEEGPMRESYTRSMEQFARTSTAATQRMLASQQDIPKFDRKGAEQDMANVIAIATTFGALAGGLARGNMTVGMNAFTGALQGFAKGDLEVFNQKYKEWQANSDRALEINRRMVDEYKAIIGNAKLNLDVKANLMEMTANKWQDQIGANAAQMRDIERLTQLVEAQDRANETLQVRKDAANERKREFDIKTKADLAKGGMIMREDGSIGIDTSPNSPAYKRAEQIASYNQPMPNNPGGRYAGAFNELSALINQISMGKNGAPYDASRYVGKVAYARAAGTYGARVETATNEVALLLPQALEASKQEPRGKWVPINKLVQDVQAGKSDPRYYDFAFANLTLINAYGRAVNPTGVARLEDKAHAAALMSTVTDQASYERVLLRMAKEVRASHAAVALTRGDPDASVNATQNIMRMSDAQLEQYIVSNAPNANTVAAGKLADTTADNKIRITIPRATPDEDSEFPGFSIVPPQQP